MTFWVRISGIPTHFWMEENFRVIGNRLGDVRVVDARAARIQISLNADKPLRFTARARLQSGAVIRVEMKYEKLDRWCLTCRHISHDERTCPLLTEDQRREKMREREAERNFAQASREDLIRDRDVMQMRRQAGQISLPLRDRNALPLQEETRKISTKTKEGSSNPLKDKKGNQIPKERCPSDRRPDSVWNRIKTNSGYRSESRRHERRHEPIDEIHPNIREGSRDNEPGYRKRRYEESFATSKKHMGKNKQKEIPGKDHSSAKPPLARFPKMPAKSSDSQRTISDPPAKAKQGFSSPGHTRSRPFHLSVTSKATNLGIGKIVETGESSEAGSSAKKSPTFEPAIPIESNSFVGQPKLSNAMTLPPLEPYINENWYEQTLEKDIEAMILTTSKHGDEQLEFLMEVVMDTGGDLRTNHNSPKNEPMDDELMEDPALLINNETIEGIDEEDEWMNDDDLFDEGELDELLKDADSPENDQKEKTRR
ncbi:uncharacterized protein LOC112081998 [Eutrema salsugineum]|uniref:uncharacterized protein LOC112081998 n=1 Tax=Eutrema salsugineum TaxID=72664 RepID=UPI000CECF398|nr:uncharacterized protein LOC112081998 [Eutrema salsugineum]